jgi:hypothetical protein
MCLILIIVFIRCHNEAGVKKPPIGDKNILAGYRLPNGEKIIEVFLRRIMDTVQYNADSSKSKTVRAEIWAYPIRDSARGKDGKPILDSITHKPNIKIINYTILDSKNIIVDISNKNYDSLMRKDSINKK